MIKLIVPRQNQPPHEGDGGLDVYPDSPTIKKNDCLVSSPSLFKKD